MRPTERYGKLRVIGLYEYGGKYGHLGQFEYRLEPSTVVLLKKHNLIYLPQRHKIYRSLI